MPQRRIEPKSYYVKEALKAYLDAYEAELSAIADYEEQVRNGTLVTYSLEEIKKKFSLSNDDPKNCEEA